MNETIKTYCLVKDEDSHWYVIPTEKVGEWNEFFEDPEYPYKDLPKWADKVGGCPSLVTFLNYTIV